MADNSDIELSLGLSLNGRFGVDPRRHNNNPPPMSQSRLGLPLNGRANNNPLVSQSSSIANLEMMGRGKEKVKEGSHSDARLKKTCSLPADFTNKRKELLTKKRVEAKKRTWEKIINRNIMRRQFPIHSPGEFHLTNAGELPRCDLVESGGSEVCNPFKIPGTNTASGHSLPPQVAEKSVQTSKSVGVGVDNEMPCVTTMGPNGITITGLLYKYDKGAEVKIVCVCHGSFMSPAEFVKHAGRDDVTNPLKEIVVTNM